MSSVGMRDGAGALRRLGFELAPAPLDEPEPELAPEPVAADAAPPSAPQIDDRPSVGVGSSISDQGPLQTDPVRDRVLDGRGPRGETSDARVVRGRVTLAGGAPARGLVVRAFGCDLRMCQQVRSHSITDQNGQYEIPYSAQELADGAGPGAGLVVRVFAVDASRDPERPLAESAPLFNAPPEAEIDLELPDTMARPNEFELNAQAVKGMLAGQAADGSDLQLAAVTDADIDFLAAGTRIADERLRCLIQAARSVQPPVDGGSSPLPAELFYGLFRQGMPTDVEALAALPTDVVVAALERSIDENLVGAAMRPQIDALMRFLEQARSTNALKPSSDGVASVGDVLRTIPAPEALNDHEQLEFARLHGEYGSSDRLWHAVGEGELASKSGVLQRSFELRDLAAGHTPMIAALQERVADGDMASLANLAVLTSSEWLTLAFDTGSPPGLGLTPPEYAARLERSVESQYATDVLRDRLQKGLIRISNFPTELVGDFLSAHHDFDFGAHDVDAYLEAARIGSPSLRDGLLQLKRVLSLTSRIDAVTALLDKGFTSSRKITYAGYDLLGSQLGGSLPENVIRLAYNAAAARTDTGLAWASIYAPSWSDVITQPDPEPEDSAGATLRKLFGDIEACECRHCQSVLGPAAYLVDLLHFLATSPCSMGGSMLDAMLARRPDLLDLELSCENTCTEIPYVDLVLEILENEVGLPLTVPLPAGGVPDVEDDLRAGRVPPVIRTALQKTAITLGADFIVQPVPPPLILTSPRLSEWIVSDHSRRWRISHCSEQLIGWRDVAGSFKPSIPLPAFAALDAIEADLQGGSVHPDLVRQFAPDPFPPVSGTPQVTALATTPSGVPGWKVSIRQEIQVEITPGYPNGAVTVYVAAQLPNKMQMPSAQWRLIAAWLTGALSGANADAAMTLLGLPRMLPYRISHDPATQRYAVRVDTNVVLAISPESLSIKSLTYQNSSVRSDLFAQPENRNPEAYNRLRDAPFPWTLPLDLWTEEIRAFLAGLGVSRRRLMEISGLAPVDEPAYAAEVLGITMAEFAKITQSAGAEPWRAWGLEEHNNRIADTLAGVDRAGGWLDVLDHVSMVMQQSRLSYRELLEICETSMGGAATPVPRPEGECHPAKLTFGVVSPAQLDWFHRFTRLRRRLGWSARELDRALVVVGGHIDPDAVVGLSRMFRLHERLQVPPLSLSAMLGNLETQSWTRYTEEESPVAASVYERNFQPAALRTSDSRSWFELAANGQLSYLGPGVNPVHLSEHAEFAASCLGITKAELEELVASADTLGITNEVRLPNLATLYGVVQFAHALGLGIDEFLRWQTLLAREPFKASGKARAQALLDFADEFDAAARTGRSLEELEYLLRHGARGTLATTPERLRQELAAIRLALQSGDVLGDSGLDNLLVQLQRAGAPSRLIAGLRSDTALAEVLRAEIVVSPLPSPLPVIPDALRGRFYFAVNADGQSARFGCHGSVVSADFDALAHVGAGPAAVPATDRTALAARYALVRDILVSQLEYSPPPILSADVPTAAAPVIPDDFAAFLDYDVATGRVRLTGLIDANAQALLKLALPQLSAEVDSLLARSRAFVQQSPAALLPPGLASDLLRQPKTTDLVLGVLRRLVPILEPDLLAAQVSAAVGLDQAITARLLEYVHVANPGAARSARDALLAAEMLESDASAPIDEQHFAAQLEALVRIDKAALLLAGSGISAAQLEWLTGTAFDVVSINSLPAAAGETPASFAKWRSWSELLLVVRSIAGGDETVAALAAAGTFDVAKTALARAYSIPEPDVESASGDLLALAWPADFRKPGRLLQLAGVLHLLQLLGTPPATVMKLLTHEPSEQDAIAARALFAAQFDPDTAPKRLAPLSNQLRALQRDALVDHLRALHSRTDANELLDHYLIDVQMEPCMRTSRVKQAISSTQLFVQRCLLNLERRHVAASEVNARRWEWMKNYRAWEANRKIFLYAENWIEPDLRDDKTELFEQLESELLQEDLTHQSSVAAFGKYLEQASTISRLTVLTLWEEIFDNTHICMHIVARDESKAHQHYYRQLWLKVTPDWTRQDLSWTPWERIDAEIDSEHVVLFKLGGLLHLAYAVIRADDENKFWRIALATRRKTRDGWVLVKQSTDELSCPILPNKTESNTFAFRQELEVKNSRDYARVACFAGQTDPTQVLDEAENEYRRLTGTVSKLRHLKARIRVLEHYRDSLGREFYRQTNQQITVIVTLHYEDAQGNLRDTLRRHDYTGQFVMGYATDGLIIAEFPDPNDTLAYVCRSIKATAKGDPSRHKEPEKVITADRDLGDSGEWITDIVFELKPEAVARDAERILSYDYSGTFEVGEDGGITLSQPSHDVFATPDPTAYTPVLLPPPLNMEHFRSGFRRRADVPDGVPFGDILSSTSGRFTFTSSFPVSAYRDDRYCFYFVWSVDWYRVVPEGQDWIFNGLFRLSRERRDEIDTESLPVPVSGSPDPPTVPLGATADPNASAGVLGPAFKRSLAPSPYDWEVFFHIPLLIATQLSSIGRFEEARRWFHTIFDPTSSAPGDESTRYWRFKPFREAGQGVSIGETLAASARREIDISEEIEAWEDDPFNPHLIARFRIRAYQWTVVIKYIQMLIAWGDRLFRQETIEALNEATQLYVLAARILGPRPASNPKSKTTSSSYASTSLTYRDLAGHLDDFSNEWVEVENTLPFPTRPSFNNVRAGDTLVSDSVSGHEEVSFSTEPLRSIGDLYFCVPQNESILNLWDTLDQRLFNLRNCRNIDGAELRLPLFEPPIDPAILVRAAAAGVDLADVLDNLSAPLPLHRFTVTLRKASELSNELRALGGAVLAALEKKDAEELALLRNSHETALLKLTEQVRLQQIEEAKGTIAGLHESRTTAEERYRHYQRLLGTADVKVPEPGERVSLLSIPTSVAKSGLDGPADGLAISQTEQDQLRRLVDAQYLTLAGGLSSVAAGVAFAVGVYPAAALTAQSLGHQFNATASAWQAAAGYASAFGTRDAIVGGYERRRDEWLLQSNMALRELIQVDKQIATAEIRQAIAGSELNSTRQQIQNTQDIDELMTSRYSSRELYRLMSQQLLSIYFRTYQMAFELAKRAERCLQFELPSSNTSFLKPSYWDSPRKGALAAEQLQLDLQRMELAYLEQNKREHELTKRVSLLSLDPLALIMLRQTGQCEFAIPELYYDLDCAGHYLRRIKLVGLTIPCVTGQFTGVHCTLTLLSSSIRKDSTLVNGAYARMGDDSRFVDDYSSVQSIVTSSGQSDTGLFDARLADERFLPFEGAGAVSTWRLELPSEVRQFDYDTISDVILEIRFTARSGGELLKRPARAHVRSEIDQAKAAGMVRLFSIRHEFPSEWAKFTSALLAGDAKTAELRLELREEHYPYWSKGRLAMVTEALLLARTNGNTQTIDVTSHKDGTGDMVTLSATRSPVPGLLGSALGPLAPATPVRPANNPLLFYFKENALEDVWLAIGWKPAPSSP
jgi:Tc toxin complex TcA C-terminal TcB-binding domain/Neuraminidase-like domain